MLDRKKFFIILYCIACVTVVGCGKEEVVFTGSEVVVADDFTEDFEEIEPEELASEELAAVANETQEFTKEEFDIEEEEIIVHICGAVVNPGVYILPQNSRVWDGVQLAGGFRDDASTDYINQAMELLDGVQVIVPTVEEVKTLKNGEDSEIADSFGVVITEETPYGVLGNTSESENQTSVSDKVNINEADVSLLCTLSGIGEATAASIIAYREENGDFQVITDIMKVSGIKEASFSKIENDITVD
ncbi:MAG: helix-hairpin-helix domain-containing protein [Eubacteriales bacterium]